MWYKRGTHTHTHTHTQNMPKTSKQTCTLDTWEIDGIDEAALAASIFFGQGLQRFTSIVMADGFDGFVS